MAVRAGEIRVFGIDVDETEPFGIHFCDFLILTLGENDVARFAIGGLNRGLGIGRDMFAVVATETPIPILVTEVIRVGPPIRPHFREEINPINRLRLGDHVLDAGIVGIGGFQ